MRDLISRKDVIDALKQRLEDDYIDSYELLKYIKNLPSVEPKRKKGRKFLEIVVNYPKICTYPEYEGKPYYSIKYEENGDTFVGYSTYKPEVLSQYLREYFILPTRPERKTGKWILWNGPWSEYVKCTACDEMYNQDDLYIGGNDYPKFCPNCGAKMTRGG